MADEGDRRDPVERGLHFATRMAHDTQDDVSALATDLYALLDVLMERGVLDATRYLNARRDQESHFAERRKLRLRVVFGGDEDKYSAEGGADIDCASLVHLCKARCCSFKFALSKQDLDEGVVRWEYAEPYVIRHEGGRCTHLDRETGACHVYEHRPLPCRRFDCREDRRIWTDFAARIPAP